MKWFLSFLITAVLGLSYVYAQTVPAPQGTAAMVCANNTVVPTPTNGKFFYVQCNAAGALITNGLAGSPGQIPGTATNDNANPGNVGEYLSNSVPNTNVNLTSFTVVNSGAVITLTPGDWDLTATAEFSFTNTTSISQWVCSTSTTTGALDTSFGHQNKINTAPVTPTAGTNDCWVGPTRYSVAVPTTVYLVVRSTFTTSTQTAGGIITARRAR